MGQDREGSYTFPITYPISAYQWGKNRADPRHKEHHPHSGPTFGLTGAPAIGVVVR